MRIILALCIVVGCTLCGKSLAGTARRRVEVLKAMIDSLRQLKIRMVSMFEPIQDALSQVASPVLAQVGGRMGEGMSAGSAWAAVKGATGRRGGMTDALSRGDLETLDHMFDRLGESGRESQEALLSGTLESLERQLGKARTRASEAERLYVSLGLLIGLMLALIVV